MLGGMQFRVLQMLFWALAPVLLEALTTSPWATSGPEARLGLTGREDKGAILDLRYSGALRCCNFVVRAGAFCFCED